MLTRDLVAPLTTYTWSRNEVTPKHDDDEDGMKIIGKYTKTSEENNPIMRTQRNINGLLINTMKTRSVPFYAASDTKLLRYSMSSMCM